MEKQLNLLLCLFTHEKLIKIFSDINSCTSLTKLMVTHIKASEFKTAICELGFKEKVC